MVLTSHIFGYTCGSVQLTFVRKDGMLCFRHSKLQTLTTAQVTGRSDSFLSLQNLAIGSGFLYFGEHP
jgi:hypothetical protein